MEGGQGREGQEGNFNKILETWERKKEELGEKVNQDKNIEIVTDFRITNQMLLPVARQLIH